MEWFTVALLLLPVIAYAEIHYRFRFWPSRLFRKEPEILFDLPHRAGLGQVVPLFLLIKDAHRFPVELQEIQVQILSQKTKIAVNYQESLQLRIADRYFYRKISLPAENFPQPGEYHLTVSLRYVNPAGKQVTLQQDNYHRIPHPAFQIYISRDSLPRYEGWYWGDLHIHSNYTEDQVEFGAPLPMLVQAARAIGLNFVAVTDHSYDLDDHPENYLKNDPALPKWTNFQQEIQRQQEEHPDMVIIAGEEVSAGNRRGRNVHCLILNDPLFHPGAGDSAEKLFSHRPTLTLDQLFERKSAKGIAIAAHPQIKPPLSQRLILGRGSWNPEDCREPHLTALQIMNDGQDAHLQAGIEFWKQLLLMGKRIGIAAGNDAHGNFNSFRQVSIPFLKMTHSRAHLLGKARTAVLSGRPQLEALLEGIRNLRMVISNGPLATLQITGNHSGQIGDQVLIDDHSVLLINGRSIPEYGHWKELVLRFGSLKRNGEETRSFAVNRAQLEISQRVKLADLDVDYVRLEAFSQKNAYRYFCFTNPIWLRKE